jgi:hypothetical protein
MSAMPSGEPRLHKPDNSMLCPSPSCDGVALAMLGIAQSERCLYCKIGV